MAGRPQAACVLPLMLCLMLSGSAHAADLLAVYRLAQHNDPTFEAAQYTLQAAQQKIPQARAGLLPVVSANGNDNFTKAESTFTSIPTVNRKVRAWTWAIQLTQPLIHVQSLYAYSESKFLVEQAQAQFAQAEQDLILRVAKAYFDELGAQQSIAVAEAQVRATNEQLALVKHGFQAGTHAVTDVDEAQSRFDLARSQRVAALNELANKHAELEKIIGQTPEQLDALQPTVVIPKLIPGEPHAWIDQARTNNPAVLAQIAALSAAQADIRKNRAMYLPTLDLVASKNANSSSGSLTTPTDYASRANSEQIGVQLTVPLYEGGATHSHVVEAISNMNKAAAELEVARRQAAADAKQAYAAIMYGLAQIEALDSAVRASQDAVKGNQAGFRLGVHMNIDVLNAEQQLYTAQRDLTKARYDTLLQGLKLKAAAGILAESDILAFNALLMH